MWCSSRHLPACGLFACLFLNFAHPVWAQDLELSVSPTPIGSGARAAGMADAFVALADDATAASWNPAGLVQLERPELSIVGAWNSVGDIFYAASFHPEVAGQHGTENLELNYLSFVYPLPFVVLDRNVTVSLNYQRKYDFSRDVSLNFNRHRAVSFFTNTSVLNSFQRLEFKQEGGLSTISPAIAFELTHRLSVGAALNFWRSSVFSENSWTQETHIRTLSTGFGNTRITGRRVKEDYRDFEGENWTLGLLWDVNDRWKAGLRYDSAFTGDVDYERRGWILQPGTSSLASSLYLEEGRQVRFPDTLALGLSWRASDRLTVAMDITRTDWNDFLVKNGKGDRISLVDGSNIDKRKEATDMDATYTVRLGAEYVFVPRRPSEQLTRLWTLRGGVFYDEEPATNQKRRLLATQGASGAAQRGDGDADKFYGVTLGLGLQLHQRVNIDVAYQYRFGRGVNKDFIRGVSDFAEDVDQHRILLSTVVYF